MFSRPSETSIVSSVIAISSLFGLHFTAKYLEKNDEKNFLIEHKKQLLKEKKRQKITTPVSPPINSSTSATNVPIYSLAPATIRPTTTYISASCTTIFLVLLIWAARSDTYFGNVFTTLSVIVISTYQLNSAYRKNSNESLRKARQWREAAEEDRDILLAGLACSEQVSANNGGATVATSSTATTTKATTSNTSDTATTQPQIELPRWVSYPDVEKVTWLNVLIRRWWPYLKADIANSIQQTLEPELNQAKPAFISKLGFQNKTINKENYVSLDFGTAPLKITGIKTYDQVGEDSIVMDIGLSLHTIDSNIVFEVGLAGAPPFAIQLSELGFSGRLRIELDHLTTDTKLEAPLGIGMVRISFTQRPDISFNLSSPQAGGISFTDVPMVHGFLTSFLKETVFSSFVLPHNIPIPLTSKLDDSAMHNLYKKPPNGIVVVRVIGVRNLGHKKWYTNFTSMGKGHLPPSTCSHYVKVKLGDEERITKSVNFSTNPIFDITFTLLVYSRDTHRLDFHVMANRLINSDNEVGYASIWLQSLQPNHQTVQTLPINTKKMHYDKIGSCIDFHCTWKPVLPKVRNTVSGIIVIDLICAHNLKAVNTIQNDADPFVKFTVNDCIKTSTIKKETLNPKWEPTERFEFVVCNSAASKLYIEVLDFDNVLLETGRSLTFQEKNKSLGHAQFDIANIASMLDPLDKTFELIDGQGRIELRLWWYSTGDGIVKT
jgi:hypothetical protein